MLDTDAAHRRSDISFARALQEAETLKRRDAAINAERCGGPCKIQPVLRWPPAERRATFGKARISAKEAEQSQSGNETRLARRLHPTSRRRAARSLCALNG